MLGKKANNNNWRKIAVIKLNSYKWVRSIVKLMERTAN